MKPAALANRARPRPVDEALVPANQPFLFRAVKTLIMHRRDAQAAANCSWFIGNSLRLMADELQ